jgi:hypothetical protein
VEVTLRSSLGGALGGYREVVLGAVGFHQNPMAFAMAWEAADRPPVLVCGPELEDAARGVRPIRDFSDRTRQVMVDLAAAGDPAGLLPDG